MSCFSCFGSPDKEEEEKNEEKEGGGDVIRGTSGASSSNHVTRASSGGGFFGFFSHFDQLNSISVLLIISSYLITRKFGFFRGKIDFFLINFNERFSA